MIEPGQWWNTVINRAIAAKEGASMVSEDKERIVESIEPPLTEETSRRQKEGIDEDQERTHGAPVFHRRQS